MSKTSESKEAQVIMVGIKLLGTQSCFPAWFGLTDMFVFTDDYITSLKVDKKRIAKSVEFVQLCKISMAISKNCLDCTFHQYFFLFNKLLHISLLI